MVSRWIAKKQRSIAQVNFCFADASYRVWTKAVVGFDSLFYASFSSQALVRERKMIFARVSDSDMLRSQSVLAPMLTVQCQ